MAGKRQASSMRHGGCLPGKPFFIDPAERGLRFGFPERGTRGYYLMDGARFYFSEKREYESQTLVFTVPMGIRTEQLRLFLDPKVPPLPPGRV